MHQIEDGNDEIEGEDQQPEAFMIDKNKIKR